ncbi:zinc dependent phospholipase C family protein [Anaerostipes sp. 494a]|uniref:zinc dependent phospholipase C family protein n=1 Tax=Anaerostipes sp. 494a TaxID=1261636 RepID=UPI000A5863C4|nr:zinc dependent phospholipase C family protein [Anaerostipes sp. 494a]
MIIHYIADYFTFPHNDHYKGNVKDHCYYERDLKHELKAFLATEEAQDVKNHVVAYDSVEECLHIFPVFIIVI